MTDNDRHVVPHSDGGWDVKAPHAERASSHHDTQAEAITRAREIIGNAGGGELVIHGADGHIRESDTVLPRAADSASTGPSDAPPLAPPAADPLITTLDLTGPAAQAGARPEKSSLVDKVKHLLHH